MSNRIIDGLPAAKAVTAIPVYSLVYHNGTGWAIASATDVATGIAMRSVNSGETLQPRPLSPGLLAVGIATAAIAANTDVVQDASGQIKTKPTSGGGTARLVGHTLDDTANNAGDWVEYVPYGVSQLITIAP